MGDDITQVEVGWQLIVPFKWRDDTPGGSNLGRAEFQVCLKFRRGRVAEFWVYPRQQRAARESWHFVGPVSEMAFHFSSYEGLPNVGPWLVGWCKEHKTTTMSVYAPDGAKFIRLDCYGLSFLKTEW